MTDRRAFVPEDLPLRAIQRIADDAVAAMGRTLKAAYATKSEGDRKRVLLK